MASNTAEKGKEKNSRKVNKQGSQLKKNMLHSKTRNPTGNGKDITAKCKPKPKLGNLLTY